MPGHESLHVVPSPTLRTWAMCNKWLWFVHINITMWVDYRASPTGSFSRTHALLVPREISCVIIFAGGTLETIWWHCSARCFVLCMTCNIYWLVWCLLNSRPSFKGWLSFCIGYIYKYNYVFCTAGMCARRSSHGLGYRARACQKDNNNIFTFHLSHFTLIQLLSVEKVVLICVIPDSPQLKITKPQVRR